MRGVPAGRASGFTLVELLVALTVAGIALAAGFAALAAVQDRSAHAHQASLELLEAAATRALLIDWIGGARLQATELQERFQGLNAAEHGLTSDELLLPTTARTPLDAPITSVRLYIDLDPATPERGLVAELLARAGDEPVRTVVVPGATGMRLRYLPDVDDAPEWLESWVGFPTLPRAVELVLVGGALDPLPPLLAMPIRVSLATLR